MGVQINSKILGATIVGLGLILGAYTMSNFGERRIPHQAVTAPPVYAATERATIEVTDIDQNGIEDWRDEFFTTPEIFIDPATSSEYTLPDTLTGITAIELMENAVYARQAGPLGKKPEEVAERLVADLVSETEQTIHGVADITIIEDWNDEDVVNYANTMAASLIAHDPGGLDHEIDIVLDIVQNQNLERVQELERLATAYQNYRDDALLIPVPEHLVKEHLDLLNAYEAIYTDISAMYTALQDPAKGFMRIRRYQDDAAGLRYAFENMVTAMIPYAEQFEPDDPALVLVMFNPDYQANL
jgi:hypothetical protein